MPQARFRGRGGIGEAFFGMTTRLYQVVDAGAAAAHARLHGFAQLDVGDGGQQGAGLITDAGHVAQVARFGLRFSYTYIIRTTNIIPGTYNIQHINTLYIIIIP